MNDRDHNKETAERRVWSRKIGGHHSAMISIPSFIVELMGLRKGEDYVIIECAVIKKGGEIVGIGDHFKVYKELPDAKGRNADGET